MHTVSSPSHEQHRYSIIHNRSQLHTSAPNSQQAAPAVPYTPPCKQRAREEQSTAAVSKTTKP